MRSKWKAAIGSTIVLAMSGAALGQAASVEKAGKQLPIKFSIAGRITDERVNVRQGPGSDYKRATLVDKDTRVVITAREGDWLQVSLPDGTAGWVGARFTESQKALPKAAVPKVIRIASVAPAAVNTVPPIKPAPVALKPAAPAVHPASGTPTVSKTAAPTPGRKAADVEKDVMGALVGTKPDLLSSARQSPATTLADSFRMVVVLLPVLALIVLAVRGLKGLQQRTGRIPDFRKGLRSGILGGFNLSNARRSGGSSIRVIESVPIGSAGLHLVEVRGRVLLLGATGSSISTLAELSETQPAYAEGGDSDFRSLLNNMSDDLHEDYSDIQGGLGRVVGSLEDQIREARESIAQSAVRSSTSRWKESDDEETSYNH